MSRTNWSWPGGAQMTLRGGNVFRLDNARIAGTFRAALPTRVADLLDIAMECYALDRLTVRDLRDPFGRGWCRHLAPVIGVREPSFWSRPDVSSALVGLLDWLTHDSWDPCFVSHSGHLSPAEAQGTLFSFRPDGPAAVACHSGGLDSFAGAAIDLGEQGDLQLVLVGASGTHRAQALQRYLGDELSFRTQRVWPLLITANLVRAKRRPQDRRQRTRGLVFLSLAAATALVAEVQEVRVYENGVGSINLPYGDGQVGAHMSRSAHPRTLLAMQRLVELMELAPVQFKAPHIFETKAELCRRVPDRFVDLIAATISCDSWSSDRQPAPAQGERAHRCGRCSSCLLRRQGLWASGYGEVDRHETYRSDALGVTATQEDTYELHMMLNQAGRLEQAVASPDPWSALTGMYPQLVEARDALVELGDGPAIERRLVDMYARYVAEWQSVPAALVQRYLPRATGVAV